MSVLTLIFLGQSLFADFNEDVVLKHKGALIYSENATGIARVKSDQKVPATVLSNACRQALLLPLKEQKQNGFARHH